MNTNRDFDRIAGAWLAAGPSELADRVLDAALDEVHLTHQRRRISVPWRLPPMNTPLRLVAAVAIIAVASYAGLTLLNPPNGPGAATPGPTLTPSPVARPFRVPDGTAAILDPGTYVLDLFPVDIAFDIPDGERPGWEVGKSTAGAAILLWGSQDFTYGLGFYIVEGIYIDPCDVAGGVQPAVGLSVDDLVAALSDQPGFQSTNPVDVTVGGFQGKEFELSVPESGNECLERLAFAGSHQPSLAPGETRRLQVLDVDGVQIVTDMIEPAQPIAGVEAELDQILGSIRIEPLP